MALLDPANLRPLPIRREGMLTDNERRKYDQAVFIATLSGQKPPPHPLEANKDKPKKQPKRKLASPVKPSTKAEISAQERRQTASP